MKLPPVIGLCGPEGGGKSTAAEILVQYYDYKRIPFAKPLKDMLAALGVEDCHLWGTPAEKAQPLPLLGGKSARQAMQWLGTEWGRQLISEDLWANAWTHAVNAAFRDGAAGVVCDDMRFANEAERVRRFGGAVWCIVRKRSDFQRVPKHASEDFAALPRDGVIYNSGSLEQLAERLAAALRKPRKYKKAA